jgi:hypothetical protein
MKKCEFMLKELKFLGYLVGAGTLKPNPSKISTVKDWPIPVTKTDVRAFLGLCGFFRRFVEHYATIAKPLTSLTSGQYTNPIPWSPAAQHAFVTLKQRLLEAPILMLPDFSQPFEIEVDASGVALGAMLLQNEVTFWHMNLGSLFLLKINTLLVKGNYKQYKQFGLEKFRHYVVPSSRYILIIGPTLLYLHKLISPLTLVERPDGLSIFSQYNMYSIGKARR